MKTLANKNIPEIEWDRGDESENHGHTRLYHANGVSEDGRKWYGKWEELNGEFEDVVEIEPVCPICNDPGETFCTENANCLNVRNI